jgi:anti-sigma factor RsiW
VSPHLPELVALAAAGALTPEEEGRVSLHIAECERCAEEARGWQELSSRLRRLPGPAPSRALVARTRETVEEWLAARAERAWNRAALGFLVAFGWTLAVVTWLAIDLATGELALRLNVSLGSTTLWFGLYLVAGWVTAGASTVLLGRLSREQGRVA